MGPGNDELLWPFLLIKTLNSMTAPWALIHLPSLAARIVHALVRLLAASGASTAALKSRRGRPNIFELLGFVFGSSEVATPWNEEKRRKILREIAPVRQKRAEALTEAAMLVSVAPGLGWGDSGCSI